MKTREEIEEIAYQKSFGSDNYRGYIQGYTQAQQDLINEASESFEIAFYRIVGGDHEGPNRTWTNEEKALWQAAKFSAFKEVTRQIEKNKALELFKKEALEVIGFYGEFVNREVCTQEHEDALKSPSMSGGLYLTGRRAVEFLAKHSEEKGDGK